MPRRARRKPKQTQPAQAAAARPDRTVLAIALGLVLLISVVFAQTVGHQFTNFHDPDYVTDNPQVTRGLSLEGVGWAFTHVVSGNWHPLTMLSHMTDAQLFGLKAGAHHFTNVLLHTATALVLFAFLMRATRQAWRSGFVAALFAIHPLRAESVAWISGRKDVLSGLFCMPALWAYARYAAQPSRRRDIWVAVLFACGLMSKPMLVTLPFILLLIDYWPLQCGEPLRKLLLEKVPLVILSIAAAVTTIIVQGAAITWVEVLPIWTRIENAVVSCFVYIRQLFWPVGLSPYYPHPKLLTIAPVLVALLVLAEITFVALRFGRTRRYLLVGWFWYLVMLLPVLGIVQVGMQAHADRYTYLPHIGLYLMLVWGISEATAGWPYRKPLLSVVAALIVASLAARAFTQTAIWH